MLFIVIYIILHIFTLIMDILIFTDNSGGLDDESYDKIFVEILKKILDIAIKNENYELCKELKTKIDEYEKNNISN